MTFIRTRWMFSDGSLCCPYKSGWWTVVSINMLLHSPSLLINETTLFVHNQSFNTPAVKKNITNSVHSWAQGLLAPSPKKQKFSSSVISAATSNEPTRLSKSIRSCTTIVESTGSLLPPPQRSEVPGAVHGKKAPSGRTWLWFRLSFQYHSPIASTP